MTADPYAKGRQVAEDFRGVITPEVIREAERAARDSLIDGWRDGIRQFER
jgi:hypothetical protein